MVNPTLYANKAFKEQVENIWVIPLVQPHKLLFKKLQKIIIPVF